MKGITQEEYEKERLSIILEYLNSDLPEDERKLVIKEELASLRKSIYLVKRKRGGDPEIDRNRTDQSEGK
jgi:hypothetical protein